MIKEVRLWKSDNIADKLFETREEAELADAAANKEYEHDLVALIERIENQYDEKLDAIKAQFQPTLDALYQELHEIRGMIPDGCNSSTCGKTIKVKIRRMSN